MSKSQETGKEFNALAGDLQRADLISYSRGRLRIEDLGKVRQRACECHEAVERNHDLIFAL